MIRYIIKFILELLWAEWQLVGILEGEARRAHEDHTVYVSCYESRWGSRFATICATRILRSGSVDSKSNRKEARESFKFSKMYMTEIRPWLNGRPHPKIPKFAIVKSGKWDFTKRLKGQTPIVVNDDE